VQTQAHPIDDEQPRQRWLALDVFRALAVLWMIQGHTFTALLESTKDTGEPFGQVYRLLHGLTAPMFLCGAGLAYGIVNFNADKPPLAGRMLRRALLLLAIGTCLQLPAAPVASIMQRRDYLISTAQPGALQLVAACLALAELLRSVTQAQGRRFALAAVSAAALAALAAPWVWQLRLSSQFVLGSWLDGHNGAQFPCLPWISFFLLGAAVSSFWGSRLWREPHWVPLLGLAGLSVSALCYWQFLSGQRLAALYGQHAFWLSNPMYVAFRAGLVLAWLATLSIASPWITRALTATTPRARACTQFFRDPDLGRIGHGHAYVEHSTWVGRVISALSRHSLVAYVVHLSLLYGLPMLHGAHGLQPSYNVYECSLACAFLLSMSVLSVLYWGRLRTFVVNRVSSQRPAPRDEVHPSQLA
jgi:uncharacterized membrane protein